MEGLRAFQVLFPITLNEKRTLKLHFCKLIALNNIILRKQARITYFFQNFEDKDQFAVTLYMIGSFFSALAARDRVNKLTETHCMSQAHQRTFQPNLVFIHI